MFWLLCIGNAQKMGLYITAPWLDGLICRRLYSIVMESDSNRTRNKRNTFKRVIGFGKLSGLRAVIASSPD